MADNTERKPTVYIGKEFEQSNFQKGKPINLKKIDKIIDGDTYQTNGVSYRFVQYDAPESNQEEESILYKKEFGGTPTELLEKAIKDGKSVSIVPFYTSDGKPHISYGRPSAALVIDGKEYTLPKRSVVFQPNNLSIQDTAYLPNAHRNIDFISNPNNKIADPEEYNKRLSYTRRDLGDAGVVNPKTASDDEVIAGAKNLQKRLIERAKTAEIYNIFHEQKIPKKEMGATPKPTVLGKVSLTDAVQNINQFKNQGEINNVVKNAAKDIAYFQKIQGANGVHLYPIYKKNSVSQQEFKAKDIQGNPFSYTGNKDFQTGNDFYSYSGNRKTASLVTGDKTGDKTGNEVVPNNETPKIETFNKEDNSNKDGSRKKFKIEGATFIEELEPLLLDWASMAPNASALSFGAQALRIRNQAKNSGYSNDLKGYLEVIKRNPIEEGSELLMNTADAALDYGAPALGSLFGGVGAVPGEIAGEAARTLTRTQKFAKTAKNVKNFLTKNKSLIAAGAVAGLEAGELSQDAFNRIGEIVKGGELKIDDLEHLISIVSLIKRKKSAKGTNLPRKSKNQKAQLKLAEKNPVYDNVDKSFTPKVTPYKKGGKLIFKTGGKFTKHQSLQGSTLIKNKTNPVKGSLNYNPYDIIGEENIDINVPYKKRPIILPTVNTDEITSGDLGVKDKLLEGINPKKYTPVYGGSMFFENYKKNPKPPIDGGKEKRKLMSPSTAYDIGSLAFNVARLIGANKPTKRPEFPQSEMFAEVVRPAQGLNRAIYDTSTQQISSQQGVANQQLAQTLGSDRQALLRGILGVNASTNQALGNLNSQDAEMYRQDKNQQDGLLAQIQQTNVGMRNADKQNKYQQDAQYTAQVAAMKNAQAQAAQQGILNTMGNAANNATTLRNSRTMLKNMELANDRTFNIKYYGDMSINVYNKYLDAMEKGDKESANKFLQEYNDLKAKKERYRNTSALEEFDKDNNYIVGGWRPESSKKGGKLKFKSGGAVDTPADKMARVQYQEGMKNYRENIKGVRNYDNNVVKLAMKTADVLQKTNANTLNYAAKLITRSINTNKNSNIRIKLSR